MRTDPPPPDLTPVLKDAFISVIVPVFNEASHIVANLELLIREVERYFSKYEILVISDGSTDGTNLELAKVKCPHLRVHVFDRNRGKGHAVRSGFALAKGDYVFFIDGGMELHPKEIRIFLGLLALYDADIVIGSKRHPQSRVYYPTYRKVLSFIYQLLVRSLFDLSVTDTQVGIKLFRRDVIQSVLPHLKIDRYGFDLEILSLAKMRGFEHVLEAPIRLDYFLEQQERRFFVVEAAHIARVGATLLSDTAKLYWKVRRLERTGRKP